MDSKNAAINILLNSGMSLQEAQTYYDTEIVPTDDFEKAVKQADLSRASQTVAQGVVEGAREAYTGGFRTIRDNVRQYGLPYAIRTAPISVAAGIGRGIGSAVGGVLGAVDDLTGNIVSETVNPVIQRAAQSNIGQQVIGGAQSFNQALRGLPGEALDAAQIFDVVAPVSGVARGGIRQVAQQGVRQAVQQGTESGLRGFINRTRNIAGDTVETFSPSTRAGRVAQESIEAGIEVNPETVRTAVSRGFPDEDAAFVSSISVEDKPIFRKMQELAEKATVNKRATYGTRPIDVVGDNLVDRIKPIQNLEKTLGREVDRIANTLKGQSINNQQLNETFTEILNDAGISGVPTNWNFSNSRFQFVPEIQKRLGDTIDKLYVAVQEGDAYSWHNLKKAIDETVDYSKNVEGLTGNAQNLLKNFRRSIDEALDTSFPEYNNVNSYFKTIREFVEETESVIGKNITKERAANRLRRIFSNADSRGDVNAYLGKLDEISRAFDIPVSGNLLDQALFSEILEKLYGTQAITSLQGEVSKAIQGVQNVTQALRDPIRGVGQLVASGIETVAGQTDSARKNFLRELLNE